MGISVPGTSLHLPHESFQLRRRTLRLLKRLPLCTVRCTCSTHAFCRHIDVRSSRWQKKQEVPRALSRQNLVLGYECGSVFPAGVGPGSTSTDAVMASRFNRSVETRRWYGWLRVMFRRCAPLPSSNLVPFGRWWHARGRGPCRGEPRIALSGGYASDSARAEGSLIIDEPGKCRTPVRKNQRCEPGDF